MRMDFTAKARIDFIVGAINDSESAKTLTSPAPRAVVIHRSIGGSWRDAGVDFFVRKEEKNNKEVRNFKGDLYRAPTCLSVKSYLEGIQPWRILEVMIINI